MRNIDTSADYIRSKISNMPKIAIVLGSGLGGLTNKIENATSIPYSEIPDFPQSTVAGHAGRLVFGTLDGKEVVAMDGRFHFYEGYSMKDIVHPIFVFKKLGIETLILSAASGAINTEMEPGSLMLINDHINLLGTNPMIGPNDDSLGPRFFDISTAYTPELITLAENHAQKLGIKPHKGVYCALTGPCYETAAEIRFLKTVGGDAVGMSTVPEVLTAHYTGLKVLAFACITNMATGISKTKHKHEEVVKAAQAMSDKMTLWVSAIVQDL